MYVSHGIKVTFRDQKTVPCLQMACNDFLAITCNCGMFQLHLISPDLTARCADVLRHGKSARIVHKCHRCRISHSSSGQAMAAMVCRWVRGEVQAPSRSFSFSFPSGYCGGEQRFSMIHLRGSIRFVHESGIAVVNSCKHQGPKSLLRFQCRAQCKEYTRRFFEVLVSV